MTIGLKQRAVRPLFTFCVVSLLLTACRHAQPAGQQPEPEKRSTEAQIHQHIVGEWTCADAYGCWYPRLIIAADGSLTGVLANGRRELVGTLEMSHSLLRVNWTPDKFKAARASGIPINEWDYFPVDYADDHELIMAPGISVAGRWRYTK